VKDLLKKLCYWDSPAEGAVFATLIFWLGAWCLASVFLMADGIPACFPGMFRMSSAAAPVFVWQHLLPAAAGLICLYYTVVTNHFYQVVTAERWPFGRHVLRASYLLIAAVFLLFGAGALFWVVLYLLMCWVTPLVFMPKQGRWLIPAALKPLCFLPVSGTVTAGAVIWLFVDVRETLPSLLSCCRLPDPRLIYPLSLFSVLCIFCRLEACAEAAGRPLRTLFGKGAKTVCGVFLLTYAVTLGMACAAHFRTERDVAELEHYFGRPLTFEELTKLHLQDRKADADFWRRMRELSKNFPECVYEPHTEFSPAEFARCRKALENFVPLRKMEKMLSAAPPAAEPDFRRGGLAGVKDPNFAALREFVRCEVWRVRFAIADRKIAPALAALKRMELARNCLAGNPVRSSQLMMAAVERKRLDAVERLLSSCLLTDPQLQELREQLAACRRELVKIHSRAVYAEAVGAMELCDRFAFGITGQDPHARQGLYSWRWVFPAGWYVFTRSRDVLAQAYKAEGLSRLPYKEEHSTVHFLPRVLLSGLEVSGRTIDSLNARYLAMETLIGVELEKRRTGKYPDVLKDPPRDIFGEELLYRKGKVPFIRRRWNAKKKVREEETVMVDAVAVWSKGPNRKDDQGLNAHGMGKGVLDDARALLLLKPPR